MAININNVNVTTAMNFAADSANNAMLSGLTVGGENLSPSFAPNTYAYTIAAASSASDKVEATLAQAGGQVAISYDGKNVRNGGTVTRLADGKAHPLAITVILRATLCVCTPRRSPIVNKEISYDAS